MAVAKPTFTVGIEEEYLLVDLESRNLVNDPPAAIMEECGELSGEQVSPELMRSQIEVGTRVCKTVSQARDELSRLRKVVIEVANKHGMAPIAVSAHPFAHWLDQKQTEKDRYQVLTREMQATARKLLISGMHVHVGIEDEELRIDLMNQFSYFLPHLLALSCSSPFWEGENTGLSSYRLIVFDALPRTGLPEQFSSHAEYKRHVEVLINAGLLEDASKIWWDLRPSARYPTLETRIMDVCTRLDDAVSLAAINLCITSMLYRLRRDNKRWRVYAAMLINENRWRAMRYSFDEGLIDLAKGEVVPFKVLLEELLGLIAFDAETLECQTEVQRSRDILRRGTSAHQQLGIYKTALDQGSSKDEALIAVVDWLISETAYGL
ncbi:MAG: carboxylate-amine ligase [Pseudomonadales bacterium]|mgnify:FL=1|jgi:carboxylate-amine ligase|nr:carboxylate-amine ligase [Pseudomonadales bacterium]MDP7358138.1 carboxylate-amine ligase [Pseudomonadales bacterium]MDP7594492.1 carboxylate-amine ligase [Pseudomonadales bacterium]HJN52702.1 carboxylate-amine ligase [Pseudomonadales bacterium]|tara:strand:+ start:75 stop:1211 length:1137 start_codon:yes stop_codon:yes gene_type:complete